jgi:hypothetical protein
MPVENYLVMMIAGGIGAYIGAYLKRKGENFATKEDFNSIVDQMKEMTLATKTIEARISDDVWNRQKHWEMKRDALFAVAETFHEARDRFISMLARYKAVQNTGGFENFRPEILEAKQQWLDSMTRFETRGHIASLICADKTKIELLQVYEVMRTGFSQLKEDVDNSHFMVELNEKTSKLMSAISEDLRVDAHNA